MLSLRMSAILKSGDIRPDEDCKVSVQWLRVDVVLIDVWWGNVQEASEQAVHSGGGHLPALWGPGAPGRHLPPQGKIQVRAASSPHLATPLSFAFACKSK